MHPNSLTAYAEEKPKLGRRASAILEIFTESPATAYTDREIMHALHFTDMNAVRPRITELEKAGLLREVGSIPDQQTGKTVRLMRLADQEAQRSLF